MAPVPLRIEDYGIIGDLHTAALVGTNGSIDWLCLPRFDSDACFANLLGDEENGRWQIAPADPDHTVERRYRDDTLVLETTFITKTGIVRLVDCMPIREEHPQVVRLVHAVEGSVDMRMELSMRFGYGSAVPWVRRIDGLLTAVAGPDGLALWTPAHTRGVDMQTVAEFTVHSGEHVPFVLIYYPSHEDPPRPVDAAYAIDDTTMWWQEWARACNFEGEQCEAVTRSLITLKALTYHPTGGIVAAATTSLPETVGGVRNWDYRYCWIRDASLTLAALMRGGYHEEAMDWRDWLLRAVAGDPSALQIMYGAAGERRLDEWEVDWLGGYEGSRPVRVGNAAAGQYQLDVYGEVMDALHQARTMGCEISAAAGGVIGPSGVRRPQRAEDSAWDLQVALMEFLETGWERPDDGIWEVRGPRRHFTHSKVMAWVAVDRAVQAVKNMGLPGPLERWEALRDRIHAEVCEKGWNSDLGAFSQYYGSGDLDASVLLIPLVGFLPPDDERVGSTLAAVERRLVQDGFVLRYQTSEDGAVDGLAGREGAFLACSFWLVDNYSMVGRQDDAVALFERLAGLANDVGLLSEEYDPVAGRMVGNFPQAFTHLALVNSARNLATGGASARGRRHGRAAPVPDHRPGRGPAARKRAPR